MSNQPDLLPCPHCGGKADTITSNNTDANRNYWRVFCVDCQCRTWTEPNQHLAVSAWNRRADTVALQKSRAGTVYLAGPMTGIEDYNYPAFNRSAASLRAWGFTVTNPADHGIVEGAEWGDYVRHDLAKLAACEKLALMPGWQQSKGARLEKDIADALGMETIYLRGATEEEPAAEPAEVWLGKGDKIVADIYAEDRSWTGVGIFETEDGRAHAIGESDGSLDGEPIDKTPALVLIGSDNPASMQVLVHELQQAIARLEGKL